MLKFLKNSWFPFLCVVLLGLVTGLVTLPDAPAQNGGQRAWQGTAGQPEHFFSEVAKGNIPGHSVVHKFGHGQVGTSLVPITVSNAYQTPTAAVSLEIVSNNLADALDDTGAHEYTVVGIDANYDEVTQVIAAHATAGTTAVAVPTAMLRVYRWYVSKSGVYADDSTGSHVGTLTLRVASAGATWSTIEATPLPAGQSEIGWYTVPDGYRAYIVHQEITVDSTKSVDVIFFKRTGIDDIVSPFTPMRTVQHLVGLSGAYELDFEVPLDSFPARTDIGYMGVVASGTADIAVHFIIMLVATGY
jgi:hypothetical protein